MASGTIDDCQPDRIMIAVRFDPLMFKAINDLAAELSKLSGVPRPSFSGAVTVLVREALLARTTGAGQTRAEIIEECETAAREAFARVQGDFVLLGPAGIARCIINAIRALGADAGRKG